jgi:hypothetical protein
MQLKCSILNNGSQWLRFCFLLDLSVSEQFPVGSECIVREGSLFGCVAQVLNHHRFNQVTIKSIKSKEPEFVKTIIQRYGTMFVSRWMNIEHICHLQAFTFTKTNVDKIPLCRREPYYPLSFVARQLHITPRTLSQITGIVRMQPGNINIGLNLKITSQNIEVFEWIQVRWDRFALMRCISYYYYYYYCL